MATFKINNGDSITFAFSLTGVEAADILNLEFAIGNLSYTLANGKLVQSENDPLLFYIYMLSKDTFCLNGNYPISVAINTEELGVLKKNLVGNLAVVKTNTKMNLPVPTQIITATYNFTVNPNGIIVDEFLATIAKGEKGDTGATGATGPQGIQGEDGLSAYEVAVENGFVGTEAEWLASLVPDAVDTVQHQVKLDEAIAKGQAVYVSGSNGTNILVKKASNTTEATSSKTLGLLASGGALNDFVNVVSEGLLDGLNTSTATVGDAVWLGTSGNLIFGLTNKPYAPAHLVYIGVVTRVHANQGEIFVHVQNGFELREIHDVVAQTPSNKQSIYYDVNSSLWKSDWSWFQYASGFTHGTIPSVLSDDGTTKIFEYVYTFGNRYRKIDLTQDAFYLESACTTLIVKKQL